MSILYKSVLLSISAALLAACGGGGSSSDTTPQPPQPPANIAPTITAINTQTFDEKADYTLTVAASDSDGTIASYEWTQLSGETLTLTSNDAATLNISTPDITNNSDGQLQIVVTDDDGVTATSTVDFTIVAGAIISIADTSIVEGDDGNSAMAFTLSLNKASSENITVDYATSDNTATAGADYEAANGTVIFAAGEITKTINVNVIGDILYADEDGEETFNITLSNAIMDISDASALGTIINDDMTEAEAKTSLIKQLESYYIVIHQQGLGEKEISMDLGNDGDDDLIVMNNSYDSSTDLFTSYPLSYFVNNKGKGFTQVETDISLHSRFYEVVDVNGDGLDDLISVADHVRRVVDGQVYREDRVRLLIQDQNGDLIDSSNSVEEHYADWHGLAALDIELDGDIDFVATGLHDSLYAFINDGTGNYAKTQSNLPIDELNLFRGSSELFFTNVHAIDLNDDGYKEILLGSTDEDHLYVNAEPLMPILRNHNGTLTFDSLTDTLNVYAATDANTPAPPLVLVYMHDIDINADGCPDLLAYQADYLSNSHLKTYRSDCNGALSEVFSYQLDKDGWVEKFIVSDADNDGFDDIYGRLGGECCNIELFTNNGDFTYTHTEVSDIANLKIDLVTYIRLNIWK